MVAAAIDIFKLACIEAKVEPLNSMSGPQPAAVAATIAYEQIVKERLEVHGFPFARWDEDLVDTGETPPLPWKYSFQKPADILLVHSLSDASGYTIDYLICKNRIFTYSSTARVNATWRVEESSWPASFVGVIVKDLAATIRMAVKKDDEGAATLAQMGEVKARRSLVRQKRQNPGRRVTRPRLLQIYLGNYASPTDPKPDV